MGDVATLLGQIAQIGATGDGGYRRLAWTEEDARLGQWFAAACAERGLVVSTDRCGNQWAWWGDPDAVSPAPGAHAHEPGDETVEAAEEAERVDEPVDGPAAEPIPETSPTSPTSRASRPSPAAPAGS